LELYVLGQVLPEEALAIEELAQHDSAVAAELLAIQSGIESYAMAYGVQPGVSVKEKLFSKVIVQETAKIVPLKAAGSFVKSTTAMSSWKWVAAASFLLFFGSVALNILLYDKYKDTNKSLGQSRYELASLEEKSKMMEEEMQVVQSKYSVPVALKGMDPAPDANAKIFWMKNTGEVYIDPSNLPDVPAGKQYQLWVIVDGKPISAGMILISGKGNKCHIHKMRSFGKAEAFAVTLENEMDNPAPKGPMYVMGKM
jgi:anti-sigma-K factor RskA